MLPAGKTETIKDGTVYLDYRDPETGLTVQYSILQEATFRLGVSGFYARQIAERITKHVQPNEARLASVMFGGKMDEREAALPPNQWFKFMYKDNIGFQDVGIMDLLEKIIPFNGHTHTARMIALELDQMIRRSIVASGYDDARVFDFVPMYAIQIVDQLIRSTTWPGSQDIAFRIRSTIEKASPFQNRVKVGLDKAARSAVISLETQVAAAEAEKIMITNEIGEKMQKATSPRRRAQLQQSLEKRISKIQAKIDSEVKEASTTFKQLQHQVLVRQPMIDLALEEQQILETREQTESRRRQTSINPLVHLREAIARWSGGLFGSSFSDQIRSIRARAFMQRLSPKSFLSNIKLEFIDSMREGKGVGRSALRALGSVFTFRPFSKTVRQMAAEQKEAHEVVATVASESAKSIELSGPTPPSGPSTPPTAPPSSPPTRGPAPGTAGVDMAQIMAAVQAQLETVIDQTSDVIGDFIDETKRNMGSFVVSVQAQLAELQSKQKPPAFRPVDADEDEEQPDFEPLGESVRDLSENEVERVANELDVAVSKYGGIRREDWVKILSLLRYFAKHPDGEKGGINANLNFRLGRTPWWGLLRGLGIPAVAMGVLSPGARRPQDMTPEERAADRASGESFVRRHMERDARIANGSASFWDRVVHTVEDHRMIHDERGRVIVPNLSNRTDVSRPQEAGAALPPQYQQSEQQPPAPEQQPAPAQMKTFRRSSKFANLGLELGEHRHVGG